MKIPLEFNCCAPCCLHVFPVGFQISFIYIALVLSSVDLVPHNVCASFFFPFWMQMKWPSLWPNPPIPMAHWREQAAGCKWLLMWAGWEHLVHLSWQHAWSHPSSTFLCLSSWTASASSSARAWLTGSSFLHDERSSLPLLHFHRLATCHFAGGTWVPQFPNLYPIPLVTKTAQ